MYRWAYEHMARAAVVRHSHSALFNGANACFQTFSIFFAYHVLYNQTKTFKDILLVSDSFLKYLKKSQDIIDICWRT